MCISKLMTKSISKPILMSGIVLIGVLAVVSNMPSADALRVTYRGMEGTLTAEQQQDVLTFLLAHHTPSLAQAIMQQMLTVDPKSGVTDARMTIRESTVGDLLFCTVTAVLGTNLAGATISTIRGDGFFSGGPTDTAHFTWGDVIMFHGVPSVNSKMTLDLALTFSQ